MKVSDIYTTAGHATLIFYLILPHGGVHNDGFSLMYTTVVYAVFISLLIYPTVVYPIHYFVLASPTVGYTADCITLDTPKYDLQHAF